MVAATLFGGSLAGLALSASANDGGISMGGSPRLLQSHPSVRMASEVIRITVRRRTLTADCRFEFTNTGPACTVRMGFPDQGEGASDPDEEQDSAAVMRTPAQTTFLSFSSWVDGKPVATRLIRADTPSRYWHTKLVRFPAHSVCGIRDVYTQNVGGGIVGARGGTGFASQVAYILHTGASWHDTIGRTEVTIQLPSSPGAKARVLQPWTAVAASPDGTHLRVPLLSHNTVVYSGPGRPTLQGNTVRFVRTNWRPTQADDIELTFDYQRGPDLEAPSHPISPLSEKLLQAGSFARVKALLDAGADVDSADVDGETVLMHWLDRGDPDAEKVIRLLIARGADVNCGAEAGETSLMRAVHTGNAGIVQLLLSRGVRPDGEDDAGSTALSLAKQAHRADLVALLTRAGAAR